MRSIPTLLRMAAMSTVARITNPWAQLTRLNISNVSWTRDDCGYEITADLRQYKPSQLAVTVEGNKITIDVKYVERDFGPKYSSTQFERTFTVPQGYDASRATSTLTGGMLKVCVPHANERDVPIQRSITYIVKSTRDDY